MLIKNNLPAKGGWERGLFAFLSNCKPDSRGPQTTGNEWWASHPH